MKLLHIALISFMSLLLVNNAHAEKTKLKKGNLNALKGVKEMNVAYDYSKMTVTTKNVSEEKFVQQKQSELNKKEAGTGDRWAESWIADRDKLFAVEFKEQFEEKSGITLSDNPGAKYTIKVHTLHTETGYNIGISRRNAYIDAEVTIYETANPGNVIAVISVEDVQGRTFGGYDFDTGSRLKECYALAGKAVGKMLEKAAK